MGVTLEESVITLSPSEAAERLGVKYGTLRNWRWRGVGPPFLKVGRSVRYRLVDLADWLDDNTVSACQPPTA